MSSMLRRAATKTILLADVAWVLSSAGISLVGFLCALTAALLTQWFDIYCQQTATAATAAAAVGAAPPVLSYSLGLWSFCGADLAWVNESSLVSLAAAGAGGGPAGSGGGWYCMGIDNLLSDSHLPSWLHGTRMFEVSGCVTSGFTVLLMMLHLLAPSSVVRSSSTGFTTASLCSATFFCMSLLSVFAVPLRSESLVPPGVCQIHSVPSSSSVTLTGVAIGACLVSAAISGAIAAGIIEHHQCRRGTDDRKS